jgi:hypothetical protein
VISDRPILLQIVQSCCNFSDPVFRLFVALSLLPNGRDVCTWH